MLEFKRITRYCTAKGNTEDKPARVRAVSRKHVRTGACVYLVARMTTEEKGSGRKNTGISNI